MIIDTGVGGAISTTGGSGGFFDSAVSVGSGVVMPSGVWTKRYGDAEDQKASAMAVNAAGDMALTGNARGTIDFGNVPWTGSATDSDVFVAKLTREGHSQWSRRYGDSCDQNGSAVALTPTGNVFVAGDFCGKMDFGDTTLEVAAGERDIFVAVIDDIGEDVYSCRLGGAGPQYARAAAVDAKGNAILVGSFEKAFDDGSGPLTSAGMDDAFVIKLDPKGKVLWSQRLGGLERTSPAPSPSTKTVTSSWAGASKTAWTSAAARSPPPPATAAPWSWRSIRTASTSGVAPSPSTTSRSSTGSPSIPPAGLP